MALRRPFLDFTTLLLHTFVICLFSFTCSAKPSPFSVKLLQHFGSSNSTANSCRQQIKNSNPKTIVILDKSFSALKKPRRGPLQMGVPIAKAESILLHTQMLYNAIEILAPKLKDVDIERMKMIALVHDLAESVVPDYTPRDRIPKDIKQQMELAVMELLRHELNESTTGFGDYVFELWKEYDYKLSKEAMWVKRLDKIDAAVRLTEYHQKGYNMDYVESFVRKQLIELNSDREIKRIYEAYLKTFDINKGPAHQQYFELLQTYELPKDL